MINTQIGWLFIYLCVYGISEMVVYNLCKSHTVKIIYHLAAGIIGVGLICYDKWYNKNNSNTKSNEK